MLFDKKDDEKKLQELPVPKLHFPPKEGISSPDFGDDNEKHPLPTFPDSPVHNKFSEVAIKDAVKDDEKEDKFEPVPHLKKHRPLKVVEMEEWHPTLPKENIEDYGEPPIPKEKPTIRPLPEKIQREIPVARAPSDVFVKIDKFNSARKALAEAEQSLEEVDDLIKKIRETKMREEQELSNWEREITQAKARVQNVSENIFEKLD
jgi:hypothetical protein